MPASANGGGAAKRGGGGPLGGEGSLGGVGSRCTSDPATDLRLGGGAGGGPRPPAELCDAILRLSDCVLDAGGGGGPLPLVGTGVEFAACCCRI